MEYNLYISLNSRGEHIHVNEPEILEQFANVTEGHFVIMSETRYRFMDSFYLPGRTVFVVGRIFGEVNRDLCKVKSADQAMSLIKSDYWFEGDGRQIFVVGGNPNGSKVQKIYLVQVNTAKAGKMYPRIEGLWERLYFEDFGWYTFEVIARDKIINSR